MLKIVTLAVAQVLRGIPSDRRFLRAADRQLGDLFTCLPSQDAYHKRRARLRETTQWLFGVFCAKSPGAHDDLLLLDSTPVECGRSLETVRRSALADICGYGYSGSHSHFWNAGCIWPVLLTAPRGRWSWPRRTGRNGKSPFSCCPERCGAERPSSATRDTPAGTSLAESRRLGPLSCAHRGPTKSRRGRTLLLSGNTSNRCSGPARTYSTWSVMEPVPRRTWWCVSSCVCSRRRPASASTTSLVVGAGPSSTTLPDVASII
jgi:hypothetical protein